MDILSAKLLKTEVERKIENLVQGFIDATELNVTDVRVCLVDYFPGEKAMHKVKNVEIEAWV
jgi:hypothetical protein